VNRFVSLSGGLTAEDACDDAGLWVGMFAHEAAIGRLKGFSPA
jgi:hypothetical protein